MSENYYEDTVMKVSPSLCLNGVKHILSVYYFRKKASKKKTSLLSFYKMASKQFMRITGTPL
jgi:hypothetical protein